MSGGLLLEPAQSLLESAVIDKRYQSDRQAVKETRFNHLIEVVGVGVRQRKLLKIAQPCFLEQLVFPDDVDLGTWREIPSIHHVNAPGIEVEVFEASITTC